MLFFCCVENGDDEDEGVCDEDLDNHHFSNYGAVGYGTFVN